MLQEILIYLSLATKEIPFADLWTAAEHFLDHKKSFDLLKQNGAVYFGERVVQEGSGRKQASK